MKPQHTTRVVAITLIYFTSFVALKAAEQPRPSLLQPPPRIQPAWQLSGNAGTVAGRNFIGTTDNQPLEVKVNAQRVFRWDPHTNSPSILGGFAGNQLLPGLAGATISGGGGTYIDYDDSPPDVYSAPQIISADFGTIGGGLGNSVRSYASTVAGGLFNAISAGSDFSAIGGGNGQYVGTNSLYSTIGGGEGNSIGANTAFSTVAGGIANDVEGAFAFVGGGGGNAVQATAPGSVIGGGSGNTTAAPYSTISGGIDATTISYGQWAHSSGRFQVGFVAGGAQTSLYVVRRHTFNATPTELLLDGGSIIGEGGYRINLPNGAHWCFEAMIVGSNAEGHTAGFQIKGLIKNVAGVTTLVGTPSVISMGADTAAQNWTVAVEADDAQDALVFKVAGSPSLTAWVGSVRTSELNLLLISP
jgi:hypothetical protein